MAAKKDSGKGRSGRNSRVFRPADTPDAREGQLISLASDLVEKRLREGTASSAEIVHLLKLGSSRGRLENAKLERENLLLSAKVDQIRSQQRIESLYADALDAMKTYTGNRHNNDDGFSAFEDFDEFD